jgi:hypothetical protein
MTRTTSVSRSTSTSVSTSTSISISNFYYSLFIYFLIFTKLLYAVCTLWMVYLRFKKKDTTPLYSKLKYWKERSETIFIIGISMILIHYFSPFSNKPINLSKEEKFSIYTFGWIILLTINWEVFFKESEIFKLIQQL